MTSDAEKHSLLLQESLAAIAQAAHTWGVPSSRDHGDLSGFRDTKRRIRTPIETEAILTKKFWRTAINSISSALNLERCAIIFPLPQKSGIWRPAEHIGIPDGILANSFYVPNEGLTGRVLTGNAVYSDDILKDPRRSAKYGEKWKQSDDVADALGARSYMGEPLWVQLSDASQSSVGAIYAIRRDFPFTAQEKTYFRTASQMISLAHDRLRSWRRRYETDLRQLRISQIWELPIAQSSKYVEVLKILQDEFHFERLLLALVDDSTLSIAGAAAVGFRSDLVAETLRPLDSDDRNEDVLTWAYHQRIRFPIAVVRGTDIWNKVHKVTAFRHHVKNRLLLIPMWAASGTMIGIVLAENREGELHFSDYESRRISLFVNHAASLIELNQRRLKQRLLSETWNHIHSVLFLSTSTVRTDESYYPLAKALGDVCRILGHRRALLYRFVEQDLRLHGVAGFGVPWRKIVHHTVSLSREHGVDSEDSFAYRVIRSGLLQQMPGFGGSNGLEVSRVDEMALSFLRENTRITISGIRITLAGRCIGVLFFSENENTKAWKPEGHSELDEFMPAIGHMLAIYEEAGRAQELLRKSTAYQSLALAIDEIGKPPMDGEAFDEGSAYRSILRDTADLFDASLTQIFHFDVPVELDAGKDVPSQVNGTLLKEVARHRDERAAATSGGRMIPESEFSITNAQAADKKKWREIRIGPGRGLTASVIKSMKPVVSEDIDNDPLWTEWQREVAGTRAFLGVPLVALNGKTQFLYGALTIIRSRRNTADGRHFRLEEQQSATSIASLLASALARQGERDSSVRAKKAADDVIDQIRHCFRWFSHDIPNMIADIENSARECRDKSGEELNDRLRYLVLQAESTRAVFSACAVALRGNAAASNNGEFSAVKKYLGAHAISFQVFKLRLESLLASERTLGDTNVELLSSFPTDELTGVWENPMLYCAYALCQNALIACFEHRDESSADCPGRVRLIAAVEDENLVLRVRDDGGGVGERSIDQLTEQHYSGWTNEYQRKSSGMGLYIVRRLVEDVFVGVLSRETIDWDGRTGVEFVVKIPVTISRIDGTAVQE